MNNEQALSGWQRTLVTLAVSGLGALSTRKSSKEGRYQYDNQLKQAPWAPPGWVFAPAWTVNNFFLIKALEGILKINDPAERKRLLIKQGLIWAIFFTFGTVYFKKKSTVLAAVWTLADAALAASSFVQIRRVDKPLANNYAPLLAWTSYATTIAAYQAVKNKDEFLEVAPAELVR